MVSEYTLVCIQCVSYLYICRSLMGRGKRFTFVYSAFICIAAMQSEAMGIAALSELSLRYKYLPGLKHIARSCDPAQLEVRTCHSKLTTEFTRNQNGHNTGFTAILIKLEFAKHHISVIGIKTYPQYLQARSSKRSKRSSKSIKTPPVPSS